MYKILFGWFFMDNFNSLEKIDNSIFKQKMQLNEYGENYLTEIMNNDLFLPAYLSKNLGKWMKLEMLMGNQLTEKIGQLIKVGAGYVVLKLNTNPVSTVVCDLKCIKIVTIIYSGKIK